MNSLVVSGIFFGLLLPVKEAFARNDTLRFNEIPNPQFGFTENKGQVRDQNYFTCEDVLFGAYINGVVFHLKKGGISYQLSQAKKDKNPLSNANAGVESPVQSVIYRLDVQWLNCNTDIKVEKTGRLDGYSNYYLENCPDGVLGVSSYKEVLYENIYPGINLKWYERGGQLKYDFVIEAGVDYKQIQMEVKGALSIKLSSEENLVLETPFGTVIEEAPVVIQNQRILRSSWKVNANILSFEIDGLDPSQPFILDPAVRLWSTFYGGSGNEQGNSTSTDASGNVYLAGMTHLATGTIIATSGSNQTLIGGSSDAFLAKFNSNGVRIWSTYCGGNGVESAASCRTDAMGNIYLSGATNSGFSIATLGSHQFTFGGGISDAFLVKFNAFGIRQWGTYLGGSGEENSYGCATDVFGNVFVCGFTATNGNGIATLGSHQSVFGGILDAYLVKFNSGGVRQWGTYYGGPGYDYGFQCSADTLGNVYLCGRTTSTLGTTISTGGSHQPVLTGSYDAFLVKFGPAGARQWGTYCGGTSGDYAYSCSVDANGNIYLAGETGSDTCSSISSAGCHQAKSSGSFDVFLVKFNPTGQRLWGTFFGGTGYDGYGFCACDAYGNVLLTGETNTANGPGISVLASHQPFFGGGQYDAFLVQFSSSGLMESGTYYGGSGTEIGNSCATDLTGNIYLAGDVYTTSAAAITTPGSHQTTFGGGLTDAFLVKFKYCRDNLYPTISVNSGTICSGQSFVMLPSGATYYQYESGNASVSPTSNTTYTVVGFSNNACASNIVTSSVNVNSAPILTISSNQNDTLCSGQSATLEVTGASSYSWSTGAKTTTIVTNPANTVYYTVTGEAINGCQNSASFMQSVAECTLIEETKKNQLFAEIYPNPSNGEFKIILNENVKIELYNSIGQLVSQSYLSPGTSALNIFGEKDGLYILIIRNRETSISLRLVKISS